MTACDAGLLPFSACHCFQVSAQYNESKCVQGKAQAAADAVAAAVAVPTSNTNVIIQALAQTVSLQLRESQLLWFEVMPIFARLHSVLVANSLL